MDITDKPMETIKQWQDWYRSHRTVTEQDAPGVSKDSKENLHDTNNATSVLPDWTPFLTMTHDIYKEKAVEYFQDTICEFNEELSGQELFDCFKQAVTNYYNTQKEELERTQQLFDIVHRMPCQKTCETK